MNSPQQQRRSSVTRRPVHGVLLLDKPIGLSSNQALQKAKWLLRAEKAGHTGTLDPLATGMLPLCFGAATKFSQLHLDANKAYIADVRLGVTTTTADAEGDVLETKPVPALDQAALAAIAVQFLGDIKQVPPMYSALKKDGKALYEYAREGVTLEREARAVHIFDLQLSPTADPHVISLRVSCSKGTYIRTLGEDIGTAIGCGAHLASLRRIQTGGFTLGDSRAKHGTVSLTELEAMADDTRVQALLPVHSLLPDVPVVTLASHDAGRFLSGVRLRGEQYDTAEPLIAVWGEAPQAFLGSAHTAGGELIPKRLLSPVEVSQCVEQVH